MKVRFTTAHMLRALSCFAASLFWFAGSITAQGAEPSTDSITIERGTITGAAYEIAVPKTWNRRVLLIAHGYVPEERPLIVDFSPRQTAYRTLLEDGWIVAKTSYRRNGMIVADAISDLNALREQIVTQHGKPERVIVLGESMGGLIVTLMAERDPTHYAGALAFGAALKIDEPGANITPSGTPKIPLLFVSNQSEVTGPAEYVTKASSTTDNALSPALVRLARDGHVNVNQAERLASIRALNAWIEKGRTSLPAPKAGEALYDGTIVPQTQPSKVVAAADHREFTAHVSAVSAAYGNVTIDAQPSDVAAAGISPETWFDLSAHGKTYSAFYGSDFGSVKVGEWVMFPDADGFFTVSKNYADAAGAAGLKEGDEIKIRLPTTPAH